MINDCELLIQEPDCIDDGHVTAHWENLSDCNEVISGSHREVLSLLWAVLKFLQTFQHK